jgi:Fur family transcriptional regulator, ferric uptake regulator
MPSHPPSPESSLRRSGLRRTPIRLAVIGVLSRNGRPMSVPQILEKMKGAVDTVTVYRTLHAFVRKKLVHRVRGGDEDRSWLYAMSDPAGPRPEHLHPHFVCDGCGKVECLEKAQIPPSFLPSLGVSGGYKVRWPEVVLHGLCPKCHA